ncbi:MAG: hypothetical protein H9W81_10095 [Enterococcus sp.]|nr:hypothetical protein [Enterococcus sp.]
MKSSSGRPNLQTIRDAQQEFADQCALIEETLTDNFQFLLFRENYPYKSFLGNAGNGLSQKVIINTAEWKVTVQELEGADPVSQCVFNVIHNRSEGLAKKVLAVVKANRE